MWLPKKEIIRVDLGFEDGCYGHPVVILSPTVQDDVVTMLIVSINKLCRYKVLFLTGLEDIIQRDKSFEETSKGYQS